MRGAGDGIYLAALVVALWGTGLALGLTLGARELAAPLRRAGLLARVTAVDVLVLPPVAWALVELLALPDGYAHGVLLAAIASGGPLAIKAAQLARADVAAAVALVLVLELVNLAAVPVWALVLLPDGAELRVGEVLVTVVALVVAPLAVGVAWRRRAAAVAPRAASLATHASNLGLAVVIAVVLVRDGEAVWSAAGERVPLAAALAVVAALGLGWAASGGARPTRVASALAVGVRANGLALAIAAASFPGDAEVRAGVVVLAVFSMLLPVLVALGVRRRPEPHPASGGAGAVSSSSGDDGHRWRHENRA